MKKGWEYKTLGECCEILNGYPFKSALYSASGIRVIRITNVQKGYVIDSNPKYYPESKINEIRNFILNDEDLLISLTGNVGRVAILDKEFLPAALNQRVACLRNKDNIIDKKYLYFYLNNDIFEKLCVKNSTGAAQLNMSTVWLKNQLIPIPSLAEQRRIVSYLDSSFDLIDKIKENASKSLSEAKALFQSALAEAMEPKEGWEEKTLKDLCEIYGNYGLSVPSIPFNGIRYLRITDITEWGELNNDKVSADVDSSTQQKLEEGDILFARTGATVGKTLMFENKFGECLFAGYLIRYRVDRNKILPKFLFYLTHSKEYYEWIKNNQKAAAQPNISAKLYNNYIINYPSLSTQKQIVSRLDSLSSNVRAIEEKYQKMIAECDALKQAMLREVFE